MHSARAHMDLAHSENQPADSEISTRGSSSQENSHPRDIGARHHQPVPLTKVPLSERKSDLQTHSQNATFPFTVHRQCQLALEE